jgi:hypothetical protein
LGSLDGVDCFAEGADLVWLDQDGIGGLLVDSALQELGVGDEQVVADKLYVAAELGGEFGPVGPVVFVEAIFD